MMIRWALSTWRRIFDLGLNELSMHSDWQFDSMGCRRLLHQSNIRTASTLSMFPFSCCLWPSIRDKFLSTKRVHSTRFCRHFALILRMRFVESGSPGLQLFSLLGIPQNSFQGAESLNASRRQKRSKLSPCTSFFN